MNDSTSQRHSRYTPEVSLGGLRAAFGIVWSVSAWLTWRHAFSTHYVGYLRNAASGQPSWLHGWFHSWISMVSPHAQAFVWTTRVVETLIALCLLLGLARRSVYLIGAVFSLLIWSTAGGFGGPYTVGVTNLGPALLYVLVFVALLLLDRGRWHSPYSLDYYLARRAGWWSRVAEWQSGSSLPSGARPWPWRRQLVAICGIAVTVFVVLATLPSARDTSAPTPQNAAAAVTPMQLASSAPVSHPRDAELPPLIGTGSDVNVHLVATDKTVQIASGVSYEAWTFNGTVPGPIIHVRQGQRVHVTFTNHSQYMSHSVDFHAAQIDPSEAFRSAKPGKSVTFSFVADVPGVFIYHCGTQPVLAHMANGMYGAIVVDPSTPLPPAEHSYVLVQNEWYTQLAHGHTMQGNFTKMQAGTPDEVTFNGIANQYMDHPLTGTANQRIRLYVVNAGPNLWSAFHVIGAVFKQVYPSGDAANAISDVSTYTVAPGEGDIFDLDIPYPGTYSFVDHSMAAMSIGAAGHLQIGG